MPSLCPFHHLLHLTCPLSLSVFNEMWKGLLPPERAALGETSLATCGLAEDLRAALADDDALGVREDGGDGEAAGALYVHEEGAWCWDEGLEFVLARLGGGGWVEEIDGENHLDS